MSIAGNYYAALRLALDAGPPPELDRAADLVAGARTTYTFGNGASAALASHIATDLGKGVGLRIVSLVDNSALLTAYANDQNYECVFAEQLKVLVRDGDVALGISGSGRSQNVLDALGHARAAGARTIGFTGSMPGGDAMGECCDVVVRAPLEQIEQIEDLHVVFAHILMRLVRERR